MREGDLVVAALSQRLAPIVWVGRRTLQPTRHPLPENVNPVRIAADAFAPGVPHCDVLLCPDHAVWHEGSLMPVRYLLNGATVV